MGKVLTLLVMVLMALASVAGCLLLTVAIRSGEKQMMPVKDGWSKGWIH